MLKLNFIVIINIINIFNDRLNHV